MCGYCKEVQTVAGYKLDSNTYFDVRFDPENRTLDFIYYKNGKCLLDESADIYYCPICGRKLTESEGEKE